MSFKIRKVTGLSIIAALAWYIAAPATLAADAQTTKATHVAANPGETKKPKASFGERLAAAASEQRWTPALYDPSYRKLKYPMGDVPWYIGVCSDVIVRAYRKVGIDLQVKVHKSRLGSGDRNIDHRRVRVLRKFFTKYGKRLPVTKNPDAFQPGDLVTYYLPDGTFSKDHIAIVSSTKSATGVPLIIHNIGYGVQQEDWLFGAKITGHYRYSG
ncbi:MAG: DUF1287 domain-containing protein [Pseudomonadota bacterium]